MKLPVSLHIIRPSALDNSQTPECFVEVCLREGSMAYLFLVSLGSAVGALEACLERDLPAAVSARPPLSLFGELGDPGADLVAEGELPRLGNTAGSDTK